MDIKKMTNEELEKMSYLDIAYNFLKFEKKKLNTVDLLKEVCKILKLSDNAYEELIGDFYTSLNLDKRFLLLDGLWDLAEHNVVKVLIEDDLDDDIEDYDLDEDEDEEDEREDDIVSDETETMEDVEDDLDDDMEDLAILEDEEDEEEEEI